MVEREPLVLQADREDVEGLILHRGLRHTCGNDLRKSTERGSRWEVDEKLVCYACAAVEVQRRLDAEKHEQADKNRPRGQAMHSEGRLYPVRPYEPDKT